MFKFYSFSQDTPASTWTINHNLNTPNIIIDTIIDISGVLTKVIPIDVQAVNNNTLSVIFSSTHTGKATIAGGG